MKEFAPHQQRVIDERNELAERLEKLEAFLHTDVYNNLNSAEQNLLDCQKIAMTQYLSTLNERIGIFIA